MNTLKQFLNIFLFFIWTITFFLVRYNLWLRYNGEGSFRNRTIALSLFYITWLIAWYFWKLKPLYFLLIAYLVLICLICLYLYFQWSLMQWHNPPIIFIIPFRFISTILLIIWLQYGKLLRLMIYKFKW